MAIEDKIISFWKQVKLKSSDMFTLFKVGVGVKVPTHKLHVKDTTDPIKIEGVQNGTTDPDKFLTIDSNNIVKYRTGSEVASDIGAVSSFVLEDSDGTEVTVTNGSEIKFVETPGIDIDWTDTSDGSDTDPYDLTFTINPAQTTITSLFATDIKMGEDDETKIDFAVPNQIKFFTNNSLHTQMYENTQATYVNAFQVISSSSSSPTILVASTASSTTAGQLQFLKDRADNSPANGHDIGNISFVGKDSDDNSTFYGYIKSEISEVTSGSEGGKLTFQVASHDGELASGLVIEDGNAEDEVDVTIGSTATSETTIAGTLTMGSTAFVNNSGVVQVATQGTIDHDSLANFVAAEHIDWAGSSAGTIHSTNIPTLNQDTTGTAAIATTVTITDNESTNESNAVIFAAGADIDGGNLGLESDGTFTYNPSTGKITATGFIGTLTGDASGNAATATALETARAINGVDFNGTAPITVTAAGSTLSDTVPVSKGGTGATTLNSTSILTGNGTSAITAQSKLTYAGEILSLGEPDAGETVITKNNGAATNGGGLIIQSGRASGGTNLTGGDLTLRGGPGTGNGVSGNIVFGAGIPGSSGTAVQNVQEIGTLDSTGNLSIDGDLTVKGNDIKDDDGTVCITFDSSGNTTVTNTLNASVTGNVTGNTSGSSGSCTGNAATATALTAGNKTIDGNLTIGANEAGHDLKLYGDTNSQTLVWDASEDFLKFTDGAKIVFGTGQAAADFDSSIQANGSNLVIYNDTGNIQIGDTVEITGDLTVSGDLSIGNDAEITSVGSMVFRIDSDNNESSQTFTWKDNASDTIAALSEDGEFTVYGGALGDPHITLHQTGQNVAYGPPLLDFYREDTLVDNADLGMIRFIARDSADNSQTYAQIIGHAEESGSGTEGGKIKLQVATHDGEIQTGVLIEDGDAEDEIDVTIANGSSSLTTVAGNLNVTTNIELGHASDTTIARTAAGTVAIEGKEIQTYAKHYHFIHSGFLLNFEFSRYIPLNGSLNEQNTSTNTPEYTTFVWPYDGTVNKIWVRSEANAGDTEMKLYKGANGATVGTAMGAVTAACGANTSVEFDMTSVTNSFSQGEAMAVRIDPTNDTDAGYNVTIECIFDLTT